MVEGHDIPGSQNILIQCTIPVLTPTVGSSQGGRPWHSWISKYTDSAYHTCINFNCRFFTWWKAMTFLDLKIYWFSIPYLYQLQLWVPHMVEAMTFLDLKIYWFSVLYLYQLQLWVPHMVEAMTFLDLKIYWFSVVYLYQLQLWVPHMVEAMTFLDLKIYWFSIPYLYQLQL